MAYEKQIWNTGDIITAEKLNHIEDNIALLDNIITPSCIITLTRGNGDPTVNKTYSEIKTAINQNHRIIVLTTDTADNDRPLQITILDPMITPSADDAYLETIDLFGFYLNIDRTTWITHVQFLQLRITSEEEVSVYTGTLSTDSGTLTT